jgi:hypothetical protein
MRTGRSRIVTSHNTCLRCLMRAVRKGPNCRCHVRTECAKRQCSSIDVKTKPESMRKENSTNIRAHFSYGFFCCHGCCKRCLLCRTGSQKGGYRVGPELRPLTADEGSRCAGAAVIPDMAGLGPLSNSRQDPLSPVDFEYEKNGLAGVQLHFP